MDERIRKEVERECSKMELMLEQQKQLLRDKEKAYLNLEEEFRLALRIEASRYHELQTAHQVKQWNLRVYYGHHWDHMHVGCPD